MRLSTLGCIVSVSLGMLGLSASPAVGQTMLWEEVGINLDYEGVVPLPEGERHVSLDMDRKLLIGRSRGKKVIGWQLSGSCEIDDGRVYSVYGASRSLDDPDADWSDVVLNVEKYGDSAVATLEGRLDSSGFFYGIWHPAMNSSAAILCTLRLDSEILLWYTERYFETDFFLFWNRFRDAVRKRDRRAVAKMVRFPLESMSCMVGEWYWGDQERLSRRRFLKEFDKIFDDTVTREVLEREPLEINSREYEWSSEEDPPGGYNRLKIPEETITYTLWFNPYSEFSRIYTFAKVNGVYKLIDINCAG